MNTSPSSSSSSSSSSASVGSYVRDHPLSTPLLTDDDAFDYGAVSSSYASASASGVRQSHSRSHRAQPKSSSSSSSASLYKSAKASAPEFFLLFSAHFWILSLAFFSAGLSFWPPILTLWDLNMTSLLLNISGTFIAACTTAFSALPAQYTQTYFMYAGILNGFCNVWTSFGNLVESSDTLLYYSHGPLKALLNLLLNLGLAFICWALGRWLAMRYKASLMLAAQLDVTLRSLDKRMLVETGIGLDAGASHRNLAQLLQELRSKSLRHATGRLTLRHCAILLAVWGVFVVTTFAAHVYSDPFAYWVNVGWSVSGAICGYWLSALFAVRQRKGDVQWATFRVNMVSCLLIGTAHNMLLFRQYVPGGNSDDFVTVVQRFITGFCGAESSFAGLINETALLWTAGFPRKLPVRNLAYNLFLCMACFFAVVVSIRLAFVYNVFL